MLVSGLAAGRDIAVAAAARDLSAITRVRPDLAPVRIAPAAPAGRANPVMRVLRSNAAPLSRRQVFAVIDGEAKRVDDQVANQLGSNIELTAEVLPNATTKALPAPAAVTANFADVRNVFVLPTRYTAATLNESQAVSFNVALAVLTNLSYDAAKRGFSARLLAYLENPDDRADRSELAQEVPVSIAAEGIAELMPLKFRQLNAPQEVRLDVASPSDPYLVRAVTALDPMTDPITVGIQRPEIRVTAVNNPIRGLGLETTQINIEVDKAGPIDNEVVALRASKGTIEPGSVTLKSGAASAVLRSSGLASSTVTASRAGFAPGTENVDFAFPTIFVVATLGGGLIGALGALLIKGGQSWVRTTLVGVLAAFVVVIGYVVGIEVGGLSAPAGASGDALFFVLAVLAGIAGEKVFERGGDKKAA